MDWNERCRLRLPELVDSQGDLAPPWERFPEYERYTIGWRMGVGEDWLGLWHAFVEHLAPDLATRLAYLKRHRPAPMTWASAVRGVLYPRNADSEVDDEENSALQNSLLEMGLIASDVAYDTWLAKQTTLRWPWENAETPEWAARYWTREFWFWSRQIATCRKRGPLLPPKPPPRWQAGARAVRTGDAGDLDLARGLRSLALFLCAGSVKAPWQLGLGISDFADSYEDDMGYVDAFRLWGMSVFDDIPCLQRYLEMTGMPPSWDSWVTENLCI